MRRTKHVEFKYMKSLTSGSVKLVWMSLDRPTRSICLPQTDRTFEGRFRDNGRPFNATNWTNKLKNLYDDVYLASFESKFIYGRLKLLFWSD